LSDLVNVDANNNQLSRFHYTLRADGKRTQLDENVVNAPDPTSGLTTSSTRSVGYSYDNAGKLTSETGQDGKGIAYQNTWSYDAVGNRVAASCQKAATAGATSWAHTTSVSSAFNANDQLTSSSSSLDGGTAQVQSYVYDQNGAEKTVASASGSSTNGWNFEGKLTQTASVDANGVASGGSSNAFDAQGDRLSRVSDVGKTSQKTTSYLVDSDTSYAQVVEERASDVSDAQGGPVLQARYVWGGGLAPLAMWRRMGDGTFKLFFHLTDGQESVRQLTDASGAVTDSYFYDAWGNALAGGSGTTENPFRYTGQQRDPDGRYYLRARFYNPGMGRFLSHDPLLGDDEDPVSLHRYLYAGADGVNACDPSGQVEFSVLGVQMSINIGQTLTSMVGAGITSVAIDGSYALATGQEYGFLDAAESFAIGAITEGFVNVLGKGLQIAAKLYNARYGELALKAFDVEKFNPEIYQTGKRYWATILEQIETKWDAFRIGGARRIIQWLPFIKTELKDLTQSVDIPEGFLAQYMPAFSPNLWSWWKGALGQYSLQYFGPRQAVLAASEGMATIVGLRILQDSRQGWKWKHAIQDGLGDQLGELMSGS